MKIWAAGEQATPDQERRYVRFWYTKEQAQECIVKVLSGYGDSKFIASIVRQHWSMEKYEWRDSYLWACDQYGALKNTGLFVEEFQIEGEPLNAVVNELTRGFLELLGTRVIT